MTCPKRAQTAPTYTLRVRRPLYLGSHEDPCLATTEHELRNHGAKLWGLSAQESGKDLRWGHVGAVCARVWKIDSSFASAGPWPWLALWQRNSHGPHPSVLYTRCLFSNTSFKATFPRPKHQPHVAHFNNKLIILWFFSVLLSVCLSVCRSVCLSVCLSFCLSVILRASQSVS